MGNRYNVRKAQKGGTKGYNDVKYIPMVVHIRKLWLDTMIQKPLIIVDHNNGPKTIIRLVLLQAPGFYCSRCYFLSPLDIV